MIKIVPLLAVLAYFLLSVTCCSLALLSVAFTSSINGSYGIDSSYWLPIAKANRR